MRAEAMLGFPAWEAAGWTMLHLSWLSVLLGLLGVMLKRLLRRSTPEFRSTVAVALLAILSLTPFFSVRMSL